MEETCPADARIVAEMVSAQISGVEIEAIPIRGAGGSIKITCFFAEQAAHRPREAS